MSSSSAFIPSTSLFSVNNPTPSSFSSSSQQNLPSNSSLTSPSLTRLNSRRRLYTSTTSTSRRTPMMIRGFPNRFSGGSSGIDGSDGSGGSSNDYGNLWEQLTDFPCVFTFKIIGVSQGDFANDIIDSVATALEMDRNVLKTSFRDRGKYRSITVEAPVNTAAQIRDVYAAIDRDPRVKFKF